jgi:ketosteroid isomerase-like protein
MSRELRSASKSAALHGKQNSRRGYCVVMSEENLEVVRRAYAALSRGDADTLRGLAVPELVVDFSRRQIDRVVMRDREDALAWLSRTRDTWEDWPTWEPLELLDAGDKVVAVINTSARGKGSGVAVEAKVWNLWTLRDGKLAALKYYGDDRAAALEAAGLSE